MSAPFTHRDAAELLGSWPILEVSSFTNPTLAPNSLLVQASIIGVVRETTGGFAVGGKSMYLWVDKLGVPTQFQVVFPPGGPYTLAQVIGFINATAGIPTPCAFNDNGFLRLKSPNPGEVSYLRLQTSLSPEVFSLLGLFSETVSRGGDFQQAQIIDPTRQIAFPGQLSMQIGEGFQAAVLNRAAAQLAVNVDRDTFLLDYKRVPTRVEESITYAGSPLRLNTGNPSQGVFTGRLAGPTFDQLRDAIVVLDQNGNEFTQRIPTVLASASDFTAAIQLTPGPTPAPNGRQLINSPTVSWSPSDVKGPVYLALSNITVGFGDQLDGKPLKVIEFIDTHHIIVENLDPATGLPVPLTASSGLMVGQRVQYTIARAEVEGFFEDAGFTTPVMQQNISLSGAAQNVTAVEKNNRIWVQGATFTTQAQPGDFLVWSTFGQTVPFTNNGTFRVKKVIDDEHLELMSQDWGPVYLNPDDSLGLGQVTVRSDGNFWRQPYVKFADPTSPNLSAGRGAQPTNGQVVRFAYYVSTSIRSATDDVQAFAGTLRHDADIPASVERALLRLVGQSVNSIDDILFGDNWNSLEKVEFRLDKEHYFHGRHSTIRPDVVDMYPGVAGITNVMRAASGDAPTQVKSIAHDPADNLVYAQSAGGHTAIGIGTIPADPLFGAPYDFSVTRPTTNANALARIMGDRMSKLYLEASSHLQPAFENGYGVLSFRSLDNSVGDRFSFVGSGSEPSDLVYYRGLRLDIHRGNGAALDQPGVMTWNKDGLVGIGLGLSDEPGALLHVRGRNPTLYGSTDTELIRLEGADNNDRTVALTWKPKKGSPFFSFIEMTHDAAPLSPGDWIFDNVLTQDADTASLGGVVGSAYFRWVRGVNGFGAGTELMRLTQAGLKLPGAGELVELSGNGSGIKLSGSGPFIELDQANGLLDFKGANSLIHFEGLGAGIIFDHNATIQFNQGFGDLLWNSSTACGFGASGGGSFVFGGGASAAFHLLSNVVANYEGENQLRGKITHLGGNVPFATPRVDYEPVDLVTVNPGKDVFLSRLPVLSTPAGTPSDFNFELWATSFGLNWYSNTDYTGVVAGGLSNEFTSHTSFDTSFQFRALPNFFQVNRHHNTGSAWSDIDWMEYLTLKVPTFTEDSSYIGTQLILRDGFLNLPVSAAGAKTSNPKASGPVFPNTLYAKNIPKIFLSASSFSGISVTVDDRRGFGDVSASIDGTGQLVINWVTPMPLGYTVFPLLALGEGPFSFQFFGFVSVVLESSTSVTLQLVDHTGAFHNLNSNDSFTYDFSILIMGEQN